MAFAQITHASQEGRHIAASEQSVKWWFVGSVVLFAVVYLALDLNRLYALRYGADLGTYAQTLMNLQHGSSWNFGEWRPHFQVHDSWALGLLAPLLWLFPSAELLLLLQVVAIATAAFVLAAFARELGIDRRAAALLGIAFLLTPSAQGLAYDNFSENVFVPLLAFSGALFARRRALIPTLLIAELLLGLKEDQILFVAWFGAACAMLWDRRLGIALVALAAINGAGFAIFEALHHVRPHDPGYTFVPHDPVGVLWLLLFLLLPFAFAPLAIGWKRLALGLPLLAEILFMAPWTYEPSRIGSHYTAPLLAGAALAAAAGLVVRPGFAKAMVPLAVVATLFFNDTVLHLGRWPYIVDWSAYSRAIVLRDGTRTLTAPRDQEGVWAVSAVNPRIRLAQRPGANAVFCPAYDRSAGAFFSSLGIGARQSLRLCGGVPVAPNSPTPSPFP
ncbi:MAG TPA: DUF2079 domain-containing protein [Candidatus Tyrphobacter sp.]